MLACARGCVSLRAAAAPAAARLAARAAPPRRRAAMSAAAAASAPAPPASVAADYAALTERLREISALNGVSGLLGWDEQARFAPLRRRFRRLRHMLRWPHPESHVFSFVGLLQVMMPQGAAALRARQGAALAGVVYEKETDAALGELLSRLTASGASSSLPPYEAATVRDAARSYKRRVALSKEIAQREARLSSEGYQAWVAARAASDFSQFAPVLEQWLSLTREKCAAIDPARSPYDVSLDTFERGMTSARLDEIFAAVRDGLVPLLAAVRSRGTPPDDAWLSGAFDVGEQAALCREIAVAMGFDLERGRLDVSVHPFTGGAGPSDVRMTTRFKPTDLTEGLTGAIHETGHALYEQGRPGGAHEGLPVSEALSMGVHESQSLLWERMVALSRPFATFLLPRLRARFPQLPADKTADDLYAALNKVSMKSLIRVESDELNYPLHIILRYELESALLAGSVRVEQLPALWNEKMAAYLGVTPDTDAQGVLQDVHWSAGAIGYFPTYSLGAMMACQIFAAAKRDMPALDDDLAAVRL
jgi:Zn-dependent M32 family carboxypeptidase